MDTPLSTLTDLPWLITRFIHNERKFLRRYDVPPRKLLKLWLNGYFSYAGVLYDVDRLDLYLSDIDQHRTKQINGSMGSILRNKFVTKHFLEENYAENLPRTYGLVRNGRFTPTSSDATSLVNLLDEVGAIVCKPVSRGRGTDVFVIETTETDEIRINGDRSSTREVQELAAELSEHLVVEYIQQHAFEEAVYPDALNTMRIVTMVDPDTREPFIGASAHRFGVPTSAPTDNWSAGGIASRIDPETGELSGAVYAHGSTKEWLTEHPETGTQIAGKAVPNWQEVRELVQSVATELATILPYIGWDVTVAEDGTPIIIEGNRASDVDIMQMHEPLLADERRKRFYEYHDII